jgi:predicted O-methyltransferase YrrM
VSSRDERNALAGFSERYAIPGTARYAAMEQRVIGADYGVNGYTTVDQADELGRLLRLGPADRLLDVGTGRGWPGLYLAATSGCTLVGTDLPHNGLVAASRRARRDGIDARVGLAVAGGERQPFRRESFDAIVHTDVLC